MAKYTFIGYVETDGSILYTPVECPTRDVNEIVLRACRKIVGAGMADLEDIVVVDVVKGRPESLISGQHTSFVTDWGLTTDSDGNVIRKVE